MTSAQWQQVRDLFEQALDRGAGAAAWLRDAPADPEVTAEVSSLLEQHARAGAFLEEPIVSKGTALLDDERFEEGAAIGPYTIEREIGRGGMGRVYLATDTRLGRRVALKALAPDLTRDPRQRERLRREARAAASLTHPGICTIYALEEIDDHVLIAGEYIDGHRLREEIGGARPAAAQLLAAARELATALAHAHERGIVHRDLKPENIMRARDGRLKILDFGLALVPPALSAAALRVTEPGTLVGTPGYMAPEQLSTGASDARSDLFSLGVVLSEYATGRHPFAADHALGVMAKVLEGEPEPLAPARQDLPSWLSAAIARCLRRNPAERVQTAAEFVQALDRPAAEVPLGASRWWRYHQWSVLLLYMIAAVLTWQLKEWTPGKPRAVFLLVGVAATIGFVFRGHLLFTEAMNPSLLRDERRRAEPITLVTDLLISLALAVDVWLTSSRPVAALLTLVLAVSLALLRLVIERTTARAAFEERSGA
jgi:hypothetical protein